MTDMRARLVTANVRPTRQRLILARLLFSNGDRHVFAEELHAEAHAAGFPLSLATVYNTLHYFTLAGLLREAAIAGGRSCFDTNISNHSHFYNPRRGELLDITTDEIRVEGLPSPPAGMRISHVDVVVHLTAD